MSQMFMVVLVQQEQSLTPLLRLLVPMPVALQEVDKLEAPLNPQEQVQLLHGLASYLLLLSSELRSKLAEKDK